MDRSGMEANPRRGLGSREPANAHLLYSCRGSDGNEGRTNSSTRLVVTFRLSHPAVAGKKKSPGI
jgi:hypothetical protein